MRRRRERDASRGTVEDESEEQDGRRGRREGGTFRRSCTAGLPRQDANAGGEDCEMCIRSCVRKACHTDHSAGWRR